MPSFPLKRAEALSPSPPRPTTPPQVSIIQPTPLRSPNDILKEMKMGCGRTPIPQTKLSKPLPQFFNPVLWTEERALKAEVGLREKRAGMPRGWTDKAWDENWEAVLSPVEEQQGGDGDGRVEKVVSGSNVDEKGTGAAVEV